ncbi:ABC transporter permease [Chitinophaga ginsengisegetis]|uniref:ABC transporter permease n=1 Tax=Chitinophaga ginsengisegetis TaxID=393003 RepID=UPI00344AD324
MFGNQFKIAWRNFRKHLTHGLLNLTGLMLGLTGCFFITLYVTDEYSYDRWIPGHEQVYRAGMEVKTQTNDVIAFANTSGFLRQALLVYPQVTTATRIFEYGSNTAVSSNSGDQKKFNEKGIYFADSTLLEVLPYPLLAGNARTAMNDADGIMLTEEKAEKYFGKENNVSSYLNKILTINEKNYRVTGVLKNVPANTYFQPDFIISTVSVRNEQWFRRNMENWHGTMTQTFFKLKPGVQWEAFEKQIRYIAYQYVGDEIKANGQVYTHFIQPLTSIHLHSNLRYELSKNSDILYVRVLSFVALFILLIAGINFINLATATASSRAKEVGVRKVIGANRSQLVLQFMIEALMMSVMAFLLTAVLVIVLLPSFNQIADKSFTVSQLFRPSLIAAGLGISVGIGILAGIYPAIILSGFNPMRIIQRYGAQKKTHSLRNALVVTQFAISILLIVATIVVHRQLQFMKSFDLGIDQSQVLVIPVTGKDATSNIKTLLEKFRGQAEVISVSASGNVPGQEFGNNLFRLKSDQTKQTDTRLLSADNEFFRTYNIQLLAGRLVNMNPDTSQKSGDIMINEAALPFFGWKKPEDALGHEFDYGWGTVCGVYKDFHFTSLQRGVTPLAIFYNPYWLNYISVKMNTRDAATTVGKLEKAWQSVVPSLSFNYFFQDEAFNRQYLAEQRLGSLFLVFALFAIAIACLGLFGLASFTAAQRTKEIGIRKVLGASVAGIVKLLSRDFLALVVVAAVIAFPLAWWAMSSWLQHFAYRVPLNAWVFIVAGGGALLIALITVSFQAVKAALANPVNSLQAE